MAEAIKRPKGKRIPKDLQRKFTTEEETIISDRRNYGSGKDKASLNPDKTYKNESDK